MVLAGFLMLTPFLRICPLWRWMTFSLKVWGSMLLKCSRGCFQVEWLGLWTRLVMVIQQGEQEVIYMLVIQIVSLLEALLPKSGTLCLWGLSSRPVLPLSKRRPSWTCWPPMGLLSALSVVAAPVLPLLDGQDCPCLLPCGLFFCFPWALCWLLGPFSPLVVALSLRVGGLVRDLLFWPLCRGNDLSLSL